MVHERTAQFIHKFLRDSVKLSYVAEMSIDQLCKLVFRKIVNICDSKDFILGK